MSLVVSVMTIWTLKSPGKFAICDLLGFRWWVTIFILPITGRKKIQISNISWNI